MVESDNVRKMRWPAGSSSARHALEHASRQLAQQPRLISLRQFFEHSKHALALRITNRAKSVACYRASQRTWEVGHDEAHRASTKATHHTPEAASRSSVLTLCKTLLPQHLLKYGSELFIARLLLLFCWSRSKPECRPRKSSRRLARKVLCVWIVAAEREGASGVVFAPAASVREGVVGVVDLLELFCPRGALG